MLNLVLREKTATFVMFINQVSNIYRTLDGLPIEGHAKVEGSAVRTKRKSVSRTLDRISVITFSLQTNLTMMKGAALRRMTLGLL